MSQRKRTRDTTASRRAAPGPTGAQARPVLRNRLAFAGVAAAIVAVVVVWIVAAHRGDGAEQSPGGAYSSVVPDPAGAEGRTWDVTMETNIGTIDMVLNGADAPQAVASFVFLAHQGFFDGTDCHRITTAGIFVLQCGDPTGTGSGGPSYRFGPLENTPSDDVYRAGALAMARQPDSAASMGSQFFMVYEDSTIPSDEAGGYTVFGAVTQGLDIVRSIANNGTITGAPDGRPALSVIITKVTAS